MFESSRTRTRAHAVIRGYVGVRTLVCVACAAVSDVSGYCCHVYAAGWTCARGWGSVPASFLVSCFS